VQAALAPQDALEGELSAHSARLREGDPTAFEDIWRLTRGEAARTLLALVGPDDLDVALLEVYRRLLDRLGGGRDAGSVLEPLRALCAKVGLELAGGRADPGEPPLRAALRALPGRTRLVFVFHEMLGWPIEQAARASGLSAPRAASRLRRARERVVEALRRDQEEVCP
jgi:Sigma-70, region 4